MLQGEAERIKRFDASHPFANAENKTPPGGNPRAFALPREIGTTDLRGRDQSMECGKPSNTGCSRDAHRPASRFSGDVFGMLAMRRYAFMA